MRENAGYRESYSLESIKKGIQKNLAARKPGAVFADAPVLMSH